MRDYGRVSFGVMSNWRYFTFATFAVELYARLSVQWPTVVIIIVANPYNLANLSDGVADGELAKCIISHWKNNNSH